MVSYIMTNTATHVHFPTLINRILHVIKISLQGADCRHACVSVQVIGKNGIEPPSGFYRSQYPASYMHN